MSAEAPSAAPLMPRSRFLLAAAIVVLTVGVLQLTHVFEIPLGSWFSNSGAGGSVISKSSLVGFMKSAGYPSLFGLMVLEGSSMPVPSEVVLPLAGYLVSLGILNYWLVLAVSTTACVVGALIDYALALWLGRPFVAKMMKTFRVHGGALDRAERWFDTSGRWTVFLARFVPILGPVISLPAGLFRMDVKSFVLMTAAGALGWSAVLVYAGVLAGNAWASAFTSSTTVVDALSLVAASAATIYVTYYVYGSVRGTPGAATARPSVS